MSNKRKKMKRDSNYNKRHKFTSHDDSEENELFRAMEDTIKTQDKVTKQKSDTVDKKKEDETNSDKIKKEELSESEWEDEVRDFKAPMNMQKRLEKKIHQAFTPRLPVVLTNKILQYLVPLGLYTIKISKNVGGGAEIRILAYNWVDVVEKILELDIDSDDDIQVDQIWLNITGKSTSTRLNRLVQIIKRDLEFQASPDHVYARRQRRADFEATCFDLFTDSPNHLLVNFAKPYGTFDEKQRPNTSLTYFLCGVCDNLDVSPSPCCLKQCLKCSSVHNGSFNCDSCNGGEFRPLKRASATQWENADGLYDDVFEEDSRNIHFESVPQKSSSENESHSIRSGISGMTGSAGNAW